MIRLLLMRHAKSSWKTAAQTDHERPLNARGRQDAPQMGRRIQSLGWAPQLALVSDAARTEETWAYVAQELRPSPRFVLRSELYHASLPQIRDAVLDTVQSETTVLVLGHNPGWESAVGTLTGTYTSMTTANVALLSHDAGWREALSRRDWTLEAMLRPREPR